jgi:hypothetical protein
MSETTMPALFTVLVGDDPVRRLATNHPTTNDCWEVYDQDFGWIESKVHDVRPFIPEGTPVDRIVVLQPGEVVVDDLTLELAHSALERAAEDDEDRAAAATLDRLLSPEMYATLAARAAEPTPDPLEDARDAAIEALMNADDATKLRAVVRALLAATEGGAS